MTKTDLEKSALIERAIYDRVWDSGNFREISGWYDDFYTRMKSAENKLETDGNALAKHIVLLTNKNIELSKKVADAKQILDEKENSVIMQVDDEGCPYEHKVGLTETEKRLRVVLEIEK